MTKIKVRYLVWRDGRPRWIPGPKLRAAGRKGEDLKYASGKWMSLADAVTRAEELNVQADAIAAGAEPKPRGLPRATRTVNDLWDRFTKAREFLDLRPKTQRDYTNKARVFLADHGPVPVAAFDRVVMKAYWRDLYETRGHAMANGVLAVARLLFTFAQDIGWRTDNPALRLKIKGVKPRVVIWEPAELKALVKAADRPELAAASIGDAIVLALHTGQRKSDVLAMPTAAAETGRFAVKQSKTGTLVDVKLTPAALARAKAALERRKDLDVVAIDALIVNERTGRPYTEDQFQKRFAEIRKLAAAELSSIAGKRFQDLRDTYLTRSSRAGNDASRRAPVSGHSMRTVHETEQHYIALTADLADEAQDNIAAWLEREGIEI